MNYFFRRVVSAALGAALAAGSFAAMSVGSCAAEEAALTDTKLIFNYEGEGITIAEDEDGNVPELSFIEGTPGDSVNIPKVTLEREGYRFSGWTIDGVRGYIPGEVIQFKDIDTELTPVWALKSSSERVKAEYYVEIDGVVLGEDEKPVSSLATPGDLVKVSSIALKREGYLQIGWVLEGGQVFNTTEHFVMPDHDVQLTPNWLKMYNLTFTPGDVDRLVGATEIQFERAETLYTNLGGSDRFSRDGFKLTGWKCDYDGEVYMPQIGYYMPSCDVTMTAVWQPINYKILFDEGSSSFKQSCETDNYLLIPEPRSTKAGYTFTAWKYDGQLYYPGDLYKVEGVRSGLGYAFDAVWTKDSSFPQIVGDANGDGLLNLADAVRIMQSVGNPDKYALCEQAAVNADVDGASGVTNKDALHIQRYLMDIIPEL